MNARFFRCFMIFGFFFHVSGVLSAQANKGAVALEEVLVTARKRTENLQQVPIAVTAVSIEEMAENNISSIGDISRIAPGLDHREGRKQGAFAIRGVGQVRINELQADPGVGVYLDGIFLARNDSQLLDTLALQSVQVLRGPQGTLFGKNTVGGAILVTTKDPLEDFTINIGSKIDSFGQRDFQAAFDIPLVEGKLLTKLTLGRVRSDGYAEDFDTGRKMGNDNRKLAALQMLWDINDSMSLKTLAYYSKQNENIPPHYCKQVTLIGTLSYARVPGRSESYHEACSEAEKLIGTEKVQHENVESGFMSEDMLFGATYEWDVGVGMLKSITSYVIKGDSTTDFDFDATDLLLVGNTSHARNQLKRQGVYDEEGGRETYGQEIQFSGNAFDDRLDYTVGLFGSLESLADQLAGQILSREGWVGFESLPGLPAPSDICTLNGILPEKCLYVRGISTANVSTFNNTSLAMFTQASYDVTSNLHFTAGLRYSFEKREIETEIFGFEYIPPILPGISLPDALAGNIPITVMTETQFNQLEGTELQFSRGVVQSSDVDFKRWTPMMGLSWDAAESFEWESVDGLMVYGIYSEGFKSGGFNVLSSGIDSFDPEYVVASELGFKLDAMQRRLRLNISVYSSDYKDVQVVVAKTPSLGAPEITTNNAGLAVMSGFEMELTWLINEAWMFKASGNVINAEFLEYDDEVLDPATSQPKYVDRSDEPFPFIPDYVYNLSLRYALASNVGDFSFVLSRNTRADQFTGGDSAAGLPEFRDQATISGFSVWSSRITWTPFDDGSLRLALYGNNITDEEYVATGSSVFSGFGSTSLTMGKVRHFGLDISYEID
jgi:iron complex outermembrane receptor protein